MSFHAILEYAKIALFDGWRHCPLLAGASVHTARGDFYGLSLDQKILRSTDETALPLLSRPARESGFRVYRKIGGLLNHVDNSCGHLGRTGPIVFSAANARFLTKFPNDPTEVWSADITASRSGGETNFFESILFVETDATASIYGAEREDGRPEFLRDDLATKQQHFLAFLRKETASDNATLGPIRIIFSGHEYSSELKATKAYLTERSSDLGVGVGYLDTDGEYVLRAVAAADY